MARSTADTLDVAEQARAWELDQEAWNLPRAAGEPIAREPSGDEHDADSAEHGAEVAVIAPERTE